GILIRAFATVHARHPETRLIVVGPDSRSRRRFERSVANQGQQGIIFASGGPDGVKYSDLPRYQRSAAIFCSPATGNESQGYVLLEAMAAGVPVVASNIEGYASVITHEHDGILARPKDPDALADALSRLISDPALRVALAAQGRTRVEDYGWPRVAQQVLSYYERLLDTQRGVQRARQQRFIPPK
ncbi:MAG: glycosyltransferase family 4 protein, partial [Dehalococcoidia bacterium]